MPFPWRISWTTPFPDQGRLRIIPQLVTLMEMPLLYTHMSPRGAMPRIDLFPSSPRKRSIEKQICPNFPVGKPVVFTNLHMYDWFLHSDFELHFKKSEYGARRGLADRINCRRGRNAQSHQTVTEMCQSELQKQWEISWHLKITSNHKSTITPNSQCRCQCCC